MAAHHLDHESAMVGAGGGVQLVEGFAYGGRGRVKADAIVGAPHVIVHGLGDARDGHAVLAVQALGHTQRVFAANGHDSVEAQVADGGQGLLEIIGALERVGARRAEDGAADMQNARHTL